MHDDVSNGFAVVVRHDEERKGLFLATPPMLAMRHEEDGNDNANRNDEDDETERSDTDPGNDEGGSRGLRRHTTLGILARVEQSLVFRPPNGTGVQAARASVARASCQLQRPVVQQLPLSIFES